MFTTHSHYSALIAAYPIGLVYIRFYIYFIIVRERTRQQQRQRSLTQRAPTLEFNTTPPPPLIPPPNAELARRTQISRDFYQSLMDRHQLPE